jgi:SAM-dependent methyltransferase
MQGVTTLVRPLEDDWRDVLDAVARSRSWPTTRDVSRLAARVVDLSAAYNDPARARAAVRDAGCARLGFSFARDVPKGAAAVRELVAAGALPRHGTLRVLDLGAGLGATTWGLARALAAGGFTGAIEATWVDSDADALELGTAILRERAGREGAIDLRVRTRTAAAGASPASGVSGRFDVVLVGQLLSELDVSSPEELRRQRHAALLRSLLDERTEEAGAVVVIEPALRDRARHLHRVRDELASGGATIFAPCLHGAPCPALARESDWCHEDLAVDLPEWLVPVARAAGLRREGLTFSYVVLHRGGRRLADVVVAPAGGARLRVVSGEIRTKGKREAFVCGELAGPGGPVVTRARLMRLDRDRTPGNGPWDGVGRGDVIVVTPAPELERPRVTSASAVSIIEGSASLEHGLLGVSEPGDAESR